MFRGLLTSLPKADYHKICSLDRRYSFNLRGSRYVDTDFSSLPKKPLAKMWGPGARKKLHEIIGKTKKKPR